MTEAAILEALSNVQEPDLGKDLVTLNMIKDIRIDGNDVSFTIVLTTPACPMKDMMRTASENAVKLLVNKDARVMVNFTSQTSTNRKDTQAILSGVKNIIAVVSGKGGVGKSTISANLALALAEGGAAVGLMDADIYGPSVPIMFGVRGARPMMKEVNGKGMIVPLEKHGIKLMSIGLLVDEKNAVVWRGPMASSAIRQFVTDVDWGELDYLVIDMPPRYRRYTPYHYANRACYWCCDCYHPAKCSHRRCQERYRYVWSGTDQCAHHWTGRKYGLFHTCRAAQ